MEQLATEYEVGIGTIHRVLNARPFEGAVVAGSSDLTTQTGADHNAKQEFAS
jgi:hypothetical protein